MSVPKYSTVNIKSIKSVKNTLDALDKAGIPYSIKCVTLYYLEPLDDEGNEDEHYKLAIHILLQDLQPLGLGSTFSDPSITWDLSFKESSDYTNDKDYIAEIELSNDPNTKSVHINEFTPLVMIRCMVDVAGCYLKPNNNITDEITYTFEDNPDGSTWSFKDRIYNLYYNELFTLYPITGWTKHMTVPEPDRRPYNIITSYARDWDIHKLDQGIITYMSTSISSFDFNINWIFQAIERVSNFVNNETKQFINSQNAAHAIMYFTHEQSGKPFLPHVSEWILAQDGFTQTNLDNMIRDMLPF